MEFANADITVSLLKIVLLSAEAFSHTVDSSLCIWDDKEKWAVDRESITSVVISG